MSETSGETRLREVWHRLEGVCQRLWDADSPAAVELQTLVEEFKGEAHRAEQLLVTLRKLHKEMRETVVKEVEQACADQIRSLQLELKTAQGHNAGLEASLAKKEERVAELARDLAAKEAQNLEFHDKFLESAAEQDEARAKKMESFYQEILKKETAIEARWETRYAALEAEHRARTETLKKKHEDLLNEIKSRATALEEHYSKREQELELTQERFRTDREGWEAVRLSEQQTLAKRKEELALQAEQLGSEFKKRQVELQRVKEAMQAELSEVVRQYQARLRGVSGSGRA